MKKTKIISFQQIKKWTLLGVLMFVFGGGLIFIPDFSFGNTGTESPRRLVTGGEQGGGLFSLGALKQEEQKKLYKHVVENKCHVKAYDLDKPDKEIEKKYKEKDSCAEKSWLKDRYNASCKKNDKVYQQNAKPKDKLCKKQAKEQCKDTWKKQEKKQSKTPPDNGEKGFTKQRGENPTAAGEEASSARLASVKINNFCAYMAYKRFKSFTGSAMEKDICRTYPKKCQNGEYVGGAREFDKYTNIYKSQVARDLSKKEGALNESIQQGMDAEQGMDRRQKSEARKKMQEKIRAQEKDINKATLKLHEKEGGAPSGHYNANSFRPVEYNPDIEA